MTMAAYLEINQPEGIQKVPILNGRASLGRSGSNSIPFPGDLNVSRKHAIVHEMNGQFYLSDLGSRNGTVLNGRPVTAPTLLHDGDLVVVGEHEIYFRNEAERQAEAAEPTDFGATVCALAVRTITALVVDVRGYTILAQQIPETTLSTTFATFFQESGSLLMELGCWTQKYIGDAIMAVWMHRGMVPEPVELIPVVEGLIKVQDLASKLHTRFPLPYPIRIGAGINTGTASTGNLGSAAVADFTALGDAVNKAFRLEASTRELDTDLAMGRQTYRAIELVPAARLFQVRTAMLKGYAEPEEVYSLPFSQLRALFESLKA
jgi:adenylate cyclase